MRGRFVNDEEAKRGPALSRLPARIPYVAPEASGLRIRTNFK